jgi:hypothetical protein
MIDADELLKEQDVDEFEELAKLADAELVIPALEESHEMSAFNSSFSQTFLHIPEDLIKAAQGMDLDKSDFSLRDEVPLDRNFDLVLQLNSAQAITLRALDMLVPGVDGVFSNSNWAIADVEALPQEECNDWGIYMIFKKSDACFKAASICLAMALQSHVVCISTLLDLRLCSVEEKFGHLLR